nr:MAG TPA: hypothetical protein [Caudoviricetes sp.]
MTPPWTARGSTAALRKSVPWRRMAVRQLPAHLQQPMQPPELRWPG